MPQSLWDMFQPSNAAGDPAGFGDALTSRSNSLIGLGLGLLQPSRPLQGESTWGNALQGFQAGAQLDARTAAALAARRQHAQDRAQAQAHQKTRMPDRRPWINSTVHKRRDPSQLGTAIRARRPRRRPAANARFF